MKPTREHWGTKIGFIMAAAGSAIGLGSVWRFPYTAGEYGGGAFVLLYIICTFLLALPIFVAEQIIGRRAQTAAVAAYSNLSGKENWKIFGWFNVFSCLLILSFYSVIAGWCLSYTLMSLTNFTAGKTPVEIREVFDILYTSSGINLFWLFLFILLNVTIVMSGVRRGIEKWSRILTPALFILFLFLVLYSITMEGFPEAAGFIFKPDFSKLTAAGVLNALGVAFFTASVGLSIILTYGGYMKSEDNIPKNALIVLSMTILASLIAALTIFPIVFTFHFPPEGGPGLVFKTMPILFARLPGALLLSTLFFILLVFTAITSSISLLETIVANLIAKFSWSRGQTTLIAGGITFILGIPSAVAGAKGLFPEWSSIYGKDFFDSLNFLTSNWMMPIGGLVTLIFVGYILQKDVIREEFLRGSQWRILFSIWLVFVRVIAPLGVLLILLQDTGIINLKRVFG